MVVHDVCLSYMYIRVLKKGGIGVWRDCGDWFLTGYIVQLYCSTTCTEELSTTDLYSMLDVHFLYMNQTGTVVDVKHTR